VVLVVVEDRMVTEHVFSGNTSLDVTPNEVIQDAKVKERTNAAMMRYFNKIFRKKLLEIGEFIWLNKPTSFAPSINEGNKTI
jgi:UDP-glucose 4-epimerase